MARAGAKRAVGVPGGSGADATRRSLVAAAIETLREEGFAGASAREIARRAGCNQGLVFYHFGSVVNLLLAALDEVSALRLARYREEVARARGLPALVAAARTIFEEDLDAGHMAVLAEMIAGASSTPDLATEVAARLAPWRTFAQEAVGGALAGTPFVQFATDEHLSHAVVALYLGLEMLAHLDGDRSPALGLFDRAAVLAALFDPSGNGTATPPQVTGDEPTEEP